MIVLDTNQLDRHSLNSPLMALLRVLAKSTGHTLASSVITFNEHSAHHKYRLLRAYSQERKSRSELYELLNASGAGKSYRRLTMDADLAKEVDAAFSAYQAKLSDMFRLIELDGVSAIEALRREAWRIAPASTSFESKGTGARDAAIWLSLINESARLAQTVYFVSSDRRAFQADQCIADIDQRAASVVVLDDIGELLQVLAGDAEDEVDIRFIAESDLMRAKFWRYIQDTTTLSDVIHVAIDHPVGSAHPYSVVYGESVGIAFMGIHDVHSHTIGSDNWITGRVRWAISYPVMQTRHDAEAVVNKALWNISFEIVSTLLFKATTQVEEVEVLSVGKPSHIVGQLEELRKLN